MARILIVEDDRNLNFGVQFVLKKEGYEVISAYTISEGKGIILNEKIDFILLDINLPDGNGLSLCREIREKVDFPIVFLTANDTETDMVKGFEYGCDDYIAKPFSTELLKHKVNAILRRNTVSNKDIFEYKDLKIDFQRRSVSVRQKEISLTTTEYKLLELLIRNKGKVLTKDLLLEKLWDQSGNFVDANTLSVNIKRLRNKVEVDSRNPKYIITVFGIGYIFGE